MANLDITSGTIRTGSTVSTSFPTDPIATNGMGTINVNEPTSLTGFTRLEIADVQRQWSQVADAAIQVSDINDPIGQAHFAQGLTLGTDTVTAIDLDPSQQGSFTDTGWWDIAKPVASDTLIVDGQLELGGTLDLRALSSDWVRGQEFNILDFDLALNDSDDDGFIDSHFDEYIIPYLYSDDYAILTHEDLVDNQFLVDLGEVGEGIDGMLSWDFTELYSQGIIRVVPEPATWALFAMGLLALGLIRRRKK